MLEIPDKDRLIVALDVPDTATAEKLVTDLDDTVSFYKVGLQLIYAGGIDFARDLVAAGRKVFLDTKLLDIDNTVAHAVESIVQLGATFATVHAYPQAMRAAVGARGDASLKLLGVTVLTSMDDSDLVEAGYGRTASELVAARAGLAQDAGMDGIVASPAEAATIRRIVGPAMAIITPGIRPAGADRGDQKRVATPTMAIEAGADYLVVGRPINAAEKPRAAAEAIAAEISAAVSARKRK